MDKGSFLLLLNKAEASLKAAPGPSSVFSSMALEYFGAFGDRCVIFRIFSEGGNGETEWMCKIEGGAPPGQHNVGLIDPLGCHPDIADAAWGKETFSVRNPKRNLRTAYFREIILEWSINEIIYAPVLLDGARAEWVVAIDACGEKRFSLADIIFCQMLEELFSFRLWKEKNPEGQWSTFTHRRNAAIAALYLPP